MRARRSTSRPASRSSTPGTDIDYDGISGPLDFNGNGEPLAGSYAVLEFGADNRIDESLTSSCRRSRPTR